MARYKMVDVRVWGDQKFQSLSPIPPCGQGLWLYLLTCPQTTLIPGVISAGEMALAEGLRWDLEAFREAFREALSVGLLKANLKARIIWLPNALKYNPPQSPNVVKSWRTWWDELPECDLKEEVWIATRRQLETIGNNSGKAFVKAFDKACPKPSGKALPKPKANQEQYQEQYNCTPLTPLGGVGDSDSLPESSGTSSKRKSSSKASSKDIDKTGSYSDDFRAFWKVYPKKKGIGKAWESYQKMEGVGLPPIETLVEIIKKHKDSYDWKRENGLFIPMPATFLNQRRWEDEVEVDTPKDDGHTPLRLEDL